MHTRRLGAFLIGAWLVGTLLVTFMASQSHRNIERLFGNPPPQLAKQLENGGAEGLRQTLRYQAAEFNRHLTESWEAMQLGIVSALLATSVLTLHRNRIVVLCAASMTVLISVMYLYLTPTMAALARSFEFLPLSAAVEARETYTHYSVWYRVLEILKTMLALTIAARLLFDRSALRDKLLPAEESRVAGARRRRKNATSVDIERE